MTRPMRGAGRIVLISDITRSDRERLPDWRAKESDQRGAMALVVWVCASVLAVAAVAWWVLA